MKKVRLLKLLKQEYPGYSEKELFAAVMCGEVLVDGSVIRDTKAVILNDSVLTLNKKK